MTKEQAIREIDSLDFYLQHHTDDYSEESHTAMMMAISALKGEWNPLGSNEEGMIIGSLPEEGEEVLVTVYGQVEIDSFGCDVEYDESVGKCKYEWFCENNDIEDVKAWMPKPKPYKAESEKNEQS